MPAQGYKIPYCSQDALNRALIKRGDVAVNLGQYGHISKSCAVNGKAMWHIAPFLADLVSIQACCEFNHSQMKAAFLNLVKEKPTVSTGKYLAKVWAGLRSERLTTVLSHVRRVVRDDGRCFPMLGKMDPKDYDTLHDHVLKLVVPIAVRPDSASAMPSDPEPPSEEPASESKAPAIHIASPTRKPGKRCIGKTSSRTREGQQGRGLRADPKHQRQGDDLERAVANVPRS
eukprot:4817176-Pyramimonas_sp.AAC.1